MSDTKDSVVIVSAMQTAVTAQEQCTMILDEVTKMRDAIRAYESRRPIVKETIREVNSNGVDGADASRVAALEKRLKDFEAEARARFETPANDHLPQAIEGLVLDQRTLKARLEGLTAQIADGLSPSKALTVISEPSIGSGVVERIENLENYIAAQDDMINAARDSMRLQIEAIQKLGQRYSGIEERQVILNDQIEIMREAFAMQVEASQRIQRQFAGKVA